MSDIALRTVGLGTMYRIGEREKHRTLRDTLMHAARRPIERLRHPGAATHTSEDLWALKDIDLEVRHGDRRHPAQGREGRDADLKALPRARHRRERLLSLAQALRRPRGERSAPPAAAWQSHAPRIATSHAKTTRASSARRSACTRSAKPRSAREREAGSRTPPC